MPISSVHRECFQFRRCDTTAVQCGLETVLVSFVLSTRTPGTMMELSVEDLLRNLCVIHTNYMSTPMELCILQKCLYSTNVAYYYISQCQEQNQNNDTYQLDLHIEHLSESHASCHRFSDNVPLTFQLSVLATEDSPLESTGTCDRELPSRLADFALIQHKCIVA